MAVSQRASDRAYQTLRDEIVQWELRPGSVLGEVEQSIRLGVSRTPLREALTRLMADGLVSSQSGRGLVVTDLSLASIREIFEVRQALEEQAARLAARRGDAAVFQQLEIEFAAVNELLEHDDPARHAYYGLVARLDDAIDTAGLPLLGVVPEDEDVPYCLNRGLVLRERNYYAARAYENIAKRIMGRKTPLMKI